MKIRIAMTGRSYHQASALGDELTLPDSATVHDAIELIRDQLQSEELPTSCLVALSGSHLGTVARFEDRQLTEGDELALIAPVAGG